MSGRVASPQSRNRRVPCARRPGRSPGAAFQVPALKEPTFSRGRESSKMSKTGLRNVTGECVCDVCRDCRRVASSGFLEAMAWMMQSGIRQVLGAESSRKRDNLGVTVRILGNALVGQCLVRAAW